MFRTTIASVVALSSVYGFAAEPRIRRPYRFTAEKEAKIGMLKLENYLKKVRERAMAKTMTRAEKEGEFQAFIDWLIHVAGMSINPMTDMPKLHAAFMDFLLLCGGTEYQFKNAVSVLSAISVKYIAWGACSLSIPMPASLVVPGYLCAPIGYVVGKYSGYYLGVATYRKYCSLTSDTENANTAAELNKYLNNFKYTDTIEWSELKRAYE